MLAILIALVAVVLNGLFREPTIRASADGVLEIYAGGVGIAFWGIYALFHWLIVRDRARQARQSNPSTDSAA